MTSSKAILIGSLFIAASILFVNTIHSAAAQYAGGPFQLMHHSNTTSNAGVFRLDQATGEVSYCYIAGDNVSLVCTRPVR